MFFNLFKRTLFLERLAASRGIDLTPDPSSVAFDDFLDRHRRSFVRTLNLIEREADLRHAEREAELRRRERLAGLRK